MTQTRPLPTKALSAYLVARQTTLSTTLARIGVDQEFRGDMISADVLGRIARLLGLTPERLDELVAVHLTPSA